VHPIVHTGRSKEDFEQASDLIAARLFRCLHHLEIHRCLFLQVSAEINFRVIHTEAKTLRFLIEDSRHLFANATLRESNAETESNELELCLEDLAELDDEADFAGGLARLTECIAKLLDKVKILSQVDL